MKKIQSAKTIDNKSRNKIFFMLIVFFILLISLFFRVYYYKVVHGEEYEKQAKLRTVMSIDEKIAPNRGSIIDRNNHAFAVSTTVYNIILDANQLRELDKPEESLKTVETLAKYLDKDLEELKSYLELNTYWKIIEKMVDKETKELIEAENIRGVFYQKDTKRNYTFDTTASTVLGFMSGDNAWGLENKYNSYLTGDEGRTFITYENTALPTVRDINAVDGSTIVTTLDYVIQQYAEDAVAKAFEQFEPNNASVIVMNPKTGEILAMADSNTFNNNSPLIPIELYEDEAFTLDWESKENSERYDYLNELWTNFNISKTYEPGSVFKPMVIAKALEEGIVHKDETFICNGYKTVAGIPIRCWNRNGHGVVTLEGAIAESCNVALMDIGEKMGADLLYETYKDFGFGAQTGIDLPYEASASTLMYTPDEMGPTELATISFGQSFNATSMQIINAAASLINGGNLMQPYVVSQVIDKNNNVVYENKPTVVRKVASKETLNLMNDYMISTVEYGTGKNAKIEGYTIGGKTGTAQQDDRSLNIHTVSFYAYLPASDPDILAISVIDRPKEYITGVSSSVPMLTDLLKNITNFYKPDYSLENVYADYDTDTVLIGDLTEYSLEEAIEKINSLGLTYQIAGKGNTIISHFPKANSNVIEGTEILLNVTQTSGENDFILLPDVRGETYDNALSILIASGFQVVVTGDSDGVVETQSPPAGISLAPTSEVIIDVKKIQTDSQANTQNSS